MGRDDTVTVESKYGRELNKFKIFFGERLIHIHPHRGVRAENQMVLLT